MEVTVGDAATAKTLLSDLKAFANTTPFGFPELANASKQLLAMGIDAKDVVGTLRMIGDVSSGLNVPVGEMSYLFGQIKSRGRAMTQDLNQFAGRGVPIYRELAKVLKTNELGVREFAESGKIGFAEIKKAFVSMTSTGGQFFGMTERQSKTLAGLYSTLEDAIGDVEKSLGEALTTGVDGRCLLESITGEVEKLKPAVVGLGVSLAQTFNAALPYIRSTEYAHALAVTLGLIDPSKLYPDAYKNDRSSAVDVVKNNAQSADQLGRVQGGISQGAAAAGGAIEELKGNPLSWAKQITAAQLALIQGSQAADRQVAELQGKYRIGEKVSDAQFAEVRDRVKQDVLLMENLKQAINTGLPDFDDAYAAKLNAVQAKLRAVQTDTARALAEMEQAGREQAAKLKANEVGEWANGVTGSKPPPAGSPAGGGSAAGAAVSGGGHSADGGGYDLAKTLGESRVAQLRAAGKEEAAELLKVQQQREQELARIDQAYGAGNLSVSDSVDASRAATEAAESAAQQVRTKFRKQRSDEEERYQRENESKRKTLASTLDLVQEYQTAALIAQLKTQGRAFDAEMVASDAGWKRRFERAKTDEEYHTATVAYEAERRAKIREEEERQAKEAEKKERGGRRGGRRSKVFDDEQGQPLNSVGFLKMPPTSLQRVRDAAAGSGERELARLDLRDTLGKTLTGEKNSPPGPAGRAVRPTARPIRPRARHSTLQHAQPPGGSAREPSAGQTESSRGPRDVDQRHAEARSRHEEAGGRVCPSGFDDGPTTQARP